MIPEEPDLDLSTVLDLEQQRRREALLSARYALLNDSGTILARGSKVESPASVLALAHFLMSGDRDYVTHDGEYIERHDEQPWRRPPDQPAADQGGDDD